MIVLGLLLLAAAAVAAVELIVANDDAKIAVHMWKWTWHVDPFWLAVAGAVILAAAVLALIMMRSGSKRSRRLRRERKDLAAENRRLAKRANAVEPTQQDEAVAPAQAAATPGYAGSAQAPAGAPTAAHPAASEYSTPAGDTYTGERIEGPRQDG